MQAVTLHRQEPPDGIRPHHDGEIDWSLDLGSLRRTQGDYNAWDNVFSMEVITWIVPKLQ